MIKSRIRASIGPFQITRALGEGGMGLVYAAVHPEGWQAAVKVLNRWAAPDFIERFRREAQIEIEHPNVVRRLDAGHDADGRAYIAFELLEGEILADRLRRGPIAPAEAIELAIQLCRGLAAAHAVGVIHRDLKPDNIFLCKDGTAKILDFGIAHSIHHETRLTEAGVIIGTPSYLAPEQVHGRAEIDNRTDLWSLGVVLYEAISGRTPFARPTPLATMLAILSEPAEPLSARSPIPIDLTDTITRALQKAKADRWPDAGAFREALERIDHTRLGETPPQASRPSEQRVVAVLLAEGVKDARAIRNAVIAHRGRFFGVLGGRAIGLFGAERWEGDEVKRAASSALAIREAAERLAIASGRAEVSDRGIAGAALRRAEWVCAARLDGIGVEREAAIALEEGFDLRQDARGDVYLLTGAQATKKISPTLRPPPSLFGRDKELALISSLVARAVDESHASLMLVSGGPGIGKTTLREEAERMFAHACLRAGEAAFILVGRAESHRRDSALSMIASAFINFANEHLDAGATVEERQLALLGLVEDAFENDDDVKDHAPFLGELLGLRMPDSIALEAARRDPRLMADRVLLALKDYFAALSQRGGVALMLEDLQWADAESLDFLESIADRLSSERFFVFMTAAQGATPAALKAINLTRLELGGLGEDDVARFAQLIAGRELAPGLARAITDRTTGNPMFVLHIVRTLSDRHLLDGALPDLPLPVSVEAALQSRLDHLAPEEKELCKQASVFGRSFTLQEISALGARDAAQALESLESLVERQLIVVSRTDRYHFHSGLLAETAYRLLTREAREALHAKAARVVRRTSGAAAEIAMHLERSGQPRLAARYHARATFAATRRGDLKTALALSEKALAGELPAYAELALRLGRYDAFQFLGQRNEMGVELERANGLARTPAQKARVLAEQAWWSLRTGRAKEAVGLAERAVEIARETADRVLLVRALGRWISALTQVGRLEEANAALVEALLLTREAPVHLRALAESWRAHLATARGDYGARREAFLFAASLYRQSGDLRRAAGAGANLADAYNRLGAYAEAELALRASLDACRRIGHRQMEGYVLLNLGYALTMLGRANEALEAFDRAEKRGREIREARILLFERAYRARALLAIGEPAKAAAIAEHAAQDAERGGQAAAAVTARVALARARLELGEAQLAADAAGRALELRDQLGGVEEEEADLFLTYARALEALGRAGEAAAIRERGRDRVLEIARGIGEREWRSRFLRGVGAHRALISG